MSQTVMIPIYAMPQRTPAELLTQARAGIAEPLELPAARHAAAHLAALRAASAALAVCATPVRAKRITNVWALLAMAAPELGDWAGYFANGQARRASDPRVSAAVITDVEADAITEEAGRWIAVVDEFVASRIAATS
jgi:phosphoribosylcarboxyaminoimidazole (NCAIR) mutase